MTIRETTVNLSLYHTALLLLLLAYYEYCEVAVIRPMLNGGWGGGWQQ